MKDWISIKDQLPPAYEDVCVKNEDGVECISYRYGHSAYPQYDFVNINNVTHWMPLDNAPSVVNTQTNRQWLNSLNDMQLSLFMTVGLPCHNILYNFDVIASIHEFSTPREFREWLLQKQMYTYGYKNSEYYEEKEIVL